MRIFFLAFCCFPLLLFGQDFKNLNLNEPWEAGDSIPPFWETLRLSTQLELVQGPASSDAQLILKDLGEPAGGYLFQKVSLDPDTFAEAEKELIPYRLSARIKVDVSDTTIVMLFANGIGDGEYLVTPRQNLSQTEDFEMVSLDMWLDNRIDELQIGLYMKGGGQAVVSDFRLTQVETTSENANPQVLAFADEIIDTIAENSLFRDSLDIPSLRSRLYQMASGISQTEDLNNAVGTILRLIDNHSFILSSEQVQAWQNQSGASEDSTSGSPSPLPDLRGHMLDKRVAYIRMPGFSSGDSTQLVHFADSLQRLIAELDKPDLAGWVLDLRGNTGGNCWPMLAGIGPILGDGTCGFFDDGENQQAWSYDDGSSFAGENKVVSVSREPYIPFTPNPKVAVLIGPRTASSGEVTAIAFANRPNTVLLGNPTGGFTTGNRSFSLSNGSLLFLATSVYADRSGQLYPERIFPNEEVFIYGDSMSSEDLIEAARSWIVSD
ncbi:MAG: S41 family peptidase [Bacteroidota bacterium]